MRCDSGTEPIDAEHAEVLPGSALIREVGQDFPDDRAELEPMPREARHDPGPPASQRAGATTRRHSWFGCPLGKPLLGLAVAMPCGRRGTLSARADEPEGSENAHGLVQPTED